jgi:phosphate transport system permease protein
MTGWLFLAVALAAMGFYVAGRGRAVAIAGDHTSVLHSRPVYHGLWLALAAAGPAFVILILWSLLAPGILKQMVLSGLSDATGSLSPAQLDGLWRDIRGMVEGGTVAIRDALRERGAETYASLANLSLVLKIGAMLAAGAAGFLFAWNRISIEWRARHRVESAVMVFLMACAALAILTTIGIVLSLIAESLRFFSFVSPIDFLFGLTWTPQQMAFRADQAGGTAAFGFIPLIAGTLLITAIAMLVAAPIGLMSAVFLADYATPRVRAIGKPILEVLAGIPTVVYGFFAALTVAPFIRETAQSVGLNASSESALAAGVVMGIMIVPFVSSLSDDVINAVPQTMRDGSMALGATKSETIRRVVLPAALPGIVSALILAVSRAIGETMIVVMAAGLAANLTVNPLEAVTTVTVQIGTLLTGDQEFDSPKTLAAFALGLALFIITLCLNLVALRVVKKYREQYE